MAYNGCQTVTKQSVKVLNLIDNNDPSKPLFSNTNNTVTVTVTVTKINDRDATGFGQMAGDLWIAGTGTVGFVLTPIAN